MGDFIAEGDPIAAATAFGIFFVAESGSVSFANRFAFSCAAVDFDSERSGSALYGGSKVRVLKESNLYLPLFSGGNLNVLLYDAGRGVRRGSYPYGVRRERSYPYGVRRERSYPYGVRRERA